MKWFIALRSILTARGEEEKKAAIAEVEERTDHLEKAFIECSNGKPFFNGDHIGYLDIALGSFLGWWKVVELDANHILLDETKTPSLFKWAERFCNDPDVKPLMPETAKLAEFARKLFPKPQAWWQSILTPFKYIVGDRNNIIYRLVEIWNWFTRTCKLCSISMYPRPSIKQIFCIFVVL